jgi:hypothetical protein
MIEPGNLIETSAAEALDLLRKWQQDGTMVIVSFTCSDDENQDNISGDVIGQIAEVGDTYILVHSTNRQVADEVGTSIRLSLLRVRFRYGEALGADPQLVLLRTMPKLMVFIGPLPL